MSDLTFQDPTAPRPSGPEWYSELLTSTSPPPRRSVGFVATTIAAVILLICGAGAVVAMSDQQTDTPEAAVRGLLNAAGNGDALGILDHLDPPERDPLARFLTSGAVDLKRLGIVTPGFELGQVPGVNLSFAGLTTTTSVLRPGLVAVKVTGGTVRTRVDPAQLPLGTFAHEVAGKALDAAKPTDRTEAVHSDTAIVAIRRDGSWHVTIGYTLAEAARASTKEALPSLSESVPAIGAASAKSAVEAFLRAAAALDVRRLIELTPPDEMGALHDYAALFLPKATDAIAKMRSGPNPVTVTITDLALSSAGHPGGELVKVTRLGLRATLGSSTVELAPGARCITVTGPARSFPGTCGSSSGASTAATAALSGPLKALTAIRPDVGIVAVERNGKWYVSPTRTFLDDTAATLHALTPEAMQSLKTIFGPASLFGLASVGVPPTSAPVEGFHNAATPNIGPCVDGSRTVTFPARAGVPPIPPTRIPCAATPAVHP